MCHSSNSVTHPLQPPWRAATMRGAILLRSIVLFTLMSVVYLMPLPGSAAELSTQKYCELTVARLQLAERTWTTADRAPTEAEEGALLQAYGLTMKEYLSISSARPQEIAEFLASNPQIRTEIDSLSAKIREYIQRRPSP